MAKPISELEKEYEEVLEEYKNHIIKFIRRTWKINRKLRKLIRNTDFRKQPKKIADVLDRFFVVFVALEEEVSYWTDACKYGDMCKYDIMQFLQPDKYIIEKIMKA